MLEVIRFDASRVGLRARERS